MKIAFDQFATTCIKHCRLVTLQMHLFDVSLFIIDLLQGTKLPMICRTLLPSAKHFRQGKLGEQTVRDCCYTKAYGTLALLA